MPFDGVRITDDVINFLAKVLPQILKNTDGVEDHVNLMVGLNINALFKQGAPMFDDTRFIEEYTHHMAIDANLIPVAPQVTDSLASLLGDDLDEMLNEVSRIINPAPEEPSTEEDREQDWRDMDQDILDMDQDISDMNQAWRDWDQAYKDNQEPSGDEDTDYLRKSE